MRNHSLKTKFEKGRQNPRIIINRGKKYIIPTFLPLNSSLSLPTLKIDDNRKKPYLFNEKLPELRHYHNKKTSNIIKRKNYLTPSFKENIKHIKNYFFMSKDPKETLYITKTNKIIPQISNSYNMLHNNFTNNTNIKNEDHIKDILNYGNRENLYNYIGKKGSLYKNSFTNFFNKNISKMIKEKISNDEESEYYIKNGWSVLEYAYKEDPNLNNRANMEDKSKSIDGFNNNSNCGLFCIFVGHGGNEVASFLQKNIANYMKEFSSNLDLLFQKLDENFMNENYNQIGSTGCVVYITKEFTMKNIKKVCYCANIGDTRAI